ncbi:hypothetical protein ACFV2H_40465 [Streptomyces sp. NPDC059629]|uniref:hypothetical protein n=1 Tax=Streptomyces sp. NPDC059629 TaxID=3346889 RepID=UPI00368C7CD4
MHGPLAGIRLHLFAAGTAGAIEAVHASEVVHHDLKSANVILAPDGPWVLGFGIAQVADGTAVTGTGMLAGIRGRLSPEYYRDGTAGPPGHVFAWDALPASAVAAGHFGPARGDKGQQRRRCYQFPAALAARAWAPADRCTQDGTPHPGCRRRFPCQVTEAIERRGLSV